jgi:glucosamine 6-phosphate synthetase-like amidotransferase/phosphosugar isomerase protein
MCGIFGVSRRGASYVIDAATNNRYNNLYRSYFLKLMKLSQQRGSDSTGMFLLKDTSDTVVKRNADIFMFKDSKASSEFANDIRCKAILENVSEDTKVIVGHTRAATSGDPKCNKNNHPFLCGRIIGVHNGVITNWMELADKYKIALKSECDSEIIFALINHWIKLGNSMNVSIQKAAKEIVGSMACAVIDTENVSSITLFRRDAPLFLKTVEMQNIVLFASNVDYIDVAIREDIKEGFRYYSSSEGYLDNNFGVNIAFSGDYYWLERATTFCLNDNA